MVRDTYQLTAAVKWMAAVRVDQTTGMFLELHFQVMTVLIPSCQDVCMTLAIAASAPRYCIVVQKKRVDGRDIPDEGLKRLLDGTRLLSGLLKVSDFWT